MNARPDPVCALSDGKCIDLGKVGTSALGGAFGGLGGSVGQRIFQRFKKSGGYGFMSNINIRGPNTYTSAGDYSNWGAAAGGAAGTYGGNQYANQ